jgi:hypothetical protein
MKTKSLFIAALVMISASVTALGKDEPRNTGLAVVSVKGSEIFKIIYRSENAGKVKLTIYDAKSKLIFTETLNGTDGFILPLNFSQLLAGEYTVELIDGSGKRVEKINYKPSRSEVQAHIARLPKEDGKFLVSVVNAHNDMIQVKIYDERGNLLHAETRQVENEFAQVYAVQNVNGVTIEVSDATRSIKNERF